MAFATLIDPGEIPEGKGFMPKIPNSLNDIKNLYFGTLFVCGI